MTTNGSDSVVLITGGSNGIGLALARCFLARSAKVLVTGRHPEKLNVASKSAPGLLTFVSDISKPDDRIELAEHVKHNLPDLNVLINNAGVQRRVSLAEDSAPWSERQVEIDTLLGGPVHLSSLVIPLMLAHGNASSIINVTSGGAFFPQPFAPVYSACKAALHSYTVNLRYALSETPVRVVELAPPAVKTALTGPTVTHGVDVDEFSNKVFADFLAGEEMIGFGPTDSESFHSLIETTNQLFADNSGRFAVSKYKPPVTKSA